MAGKTVVSVVLPTYNERDTLGLLEPQLASALRGYDHELVVVDDGSPDGTGALVEELARTRPYRLVQRGRKQGLASAALRGLAESRGTLAVVMDADGSHPPAAIPGLVEPVLHGPAEFALASRWVPGGSAPGLVGTRRTISMGARLLARPLTHVRDPMSGFFAVRRSILGRAPLAPVGYKIALEILVKCAPDPVVEVPFRFEPRIAGESKLGGSEIREYARHVARLYAWKARHPVRASSTR